MTLSRADITRFLSGLHPYDSLEPSALDALGATTTVQEFDADTPVYALGEPLAGLYIVMQGQIEVTDDNGVPLSHLGRGNSFGERGLLRGGKAVTSARALSPSRLIVLPTDAFHALMADVPVVARFFDRRRPGPQQRNDLATSRVAALMAGNPLTCPPDTSAQAAAKLMHDRRISSLCVTQGDALLGILTLRDLSGKVLAAGLPFDTSVADIMTMAPFTLTPSAIGSDVLHAMLERHIGHIPIVEAGKLVGIVTQTDLTHYQAINSAELVSRLARATTAQDMAKVTAEIPQLLAQLVGAGNRHEVVTRLITDIADTATRRLLTLAETKFGPPPVPYLWLACGSQGRQEQTGVSDQDNCLFLDDAVTPALMPYFADLAKFVSDGLDVCGYFYCPGDMMATNPRWCQPVHIWRDYFTGWIAKPDPEAQMLASVMFDLRPIGGTLSLFENLQSETLSAAARNSIFVAQMVSNSLKHTPPLGMLRGLATIRSGEHRNTLDLKHNGVVPVADLARVYALQGQLTAANTRARLELAGATGTISTSGARDLIEAYDLIAQTRLEHQATLVRQGQSPDNYLAPGTLSDFERSHLRDAFVVVKTMQSAIGSGRAMLG